MCRFVTWLTCVCARAVCRRASLEAPAIEEGLASPAAADAPVEGAAAEPEVAPEPEEVDNTVTFDQYQAALAAKRQVLCVCVCVPVSCC